MAKRTYVKPELLYENFVLAQHIAACELYLMSVDVNSCTVEDKHEVGFSDAKFFMNENVCTMPPPQENYCYTNGPDGAWRAFQS